MVITGMFNFGLVKIHGSGNWVSLTQGRMSLNKTFHKFSNKTFHKFSGNQSI